MHTNTAQISYCFHCMEAVDTTQEFCPFCGHRIHEFQTNDRALPPGTILAGKYLLGEVLGEGGFGITYRGLDLNLHLKIAVKEYFPASFASRSVSTGSDYRLHIIGGSAGEFYRKGLEDYALEANRLAQFASLPGIVSVLNFFYENNTAYIIMEFIDGITLKEYLKLHKEYLPWQETLELLHPVILSMKEIHKAGIIHRDISPDNIMISKNHEMILIDFGAARTITQEHNNKTVILKKGFAPPEQYQTDGNQGPWTDVYSFCATIYRIISGQKPPEALAMASESTGIPPLKTLVKDVPNFLSTALQQGMQTDISARIRNMDELERYLYQNKRVRKRIGTRKLILILSVSCFALLLLEVFLFSGLSLYKHKASTETTLNDTVRTEDDQIEDNQTQDTPEPANSLEDGEPTEETPVQDETPSIEDSYESLEATTGFQYVEENGGIVITAVDSSITEIVIPSKIDGLTVKELRGLNANVTSVVIQNGMEKISASAFRNCMYLEFIYIPASVTSIDTDTFNNCLNLAEILVSPDNADFYSQDNKLYTKDNALLFG